MLINKFLLFVLKKYICEAALLQPGLYKPNKKSGNAVKI